MLYCVYMCVCGSFFLFGVGGQSMCYAAELHIPSLPDNSFTLCAVPHHLICVQCPLVLLDSVTIPEESSLMQNFPGCFRVRWVSWAGHVSLGVMFSEDLSRFPFSPPETYLKWIPIQLLDPSHCSLGERHCVVLLWFYRENLDEKVWQVLRRHSSFHVSLT